MENSFTSYQIEDRSYLSFVKREIHSLVLKGNFSKTRLGEIDIVVAELCSNIVKHAERGEMLYRLTMNENEPSTLELLVIDNGFGIADVARAMKDGVSSSNTLGHGLGSIQRLSNVFQLYSIPYWGTVSYTSIASEVGRTPKKTTGDLDIRSLMVPKPRETKCGDGSAVRRTGDHILVFFADGLGHGEHAWEAVQRGKEAFLGSEDVDPVSVIRNVHTHVRKTRGLVATVAALDLKERKWRMCGVGNILTRLYGGMTFKYYLPYNGIVGLNVPNSMNESVIDAEKNQQLIMCSDGIRTRWDIAKYAGILKYDNMILAGALYKDFVRGNDDASILIGKVIL